MKSATLILNVQGLVKCFIWMMRYARLPTYYALWLNVVYVIARHHFFMGDLNDWIELNI